MSNVFTGRDAANSLDPSEISQHDYRQLSSHSIASFVTFVFACHSALDLVAKIRADGYMDLSNQGWVVHKQIDNTPKDLFPATPIGTP
ncbi:hypothetical protein K439DRAFT_1640166 [Ramaria rubella]|nr:hypothetical protein K439DRAFT_1640166 [Ramaria rubella]